MVFLDTSKDKLSTLTRILVTKSFNNWLFIYILSLDIIMDICMGWGGEGCEGFDLQNKTFQTKYYFFYFFIFYLKIFFF